jgi:hypothetical protein
LNPGSGKISIKVIARDCWRVRQRVCKLLVALFKFSTGATEATKLPPDIEQDTAGTRFRVSTLPRAARTVCEILERRCLLTSLPDAAANVADLFLASIFWLLC